MDANKMTAAELRALADLKAEEEDRIIKVGFLKFDLYDFESYNWPSGHGGLHYYKPWDNFWLYSFSDKEDVVFDFKSHFKIALKAGTKFSCRLVDGQELWYDDEGYGLDDLDNKWAEKYLEKIQNV